MLLRTASGLIPGLVASPAPGLAALLAAGLLFALLSGCSNTSPTAPAGSVTLIVDPAGAGDYTAIQPALDAAADGDTVLVTPGTYSGASNRDLDFGGADIVLMAAATRESVLIDCEGAGRGFYLHRGESRAAVIDGFVVMNGEATNGGGAYLDGASPTINDVVFVGNVAAGGDGGGMYLTDGASPYLTNVVFEENSASLGGGLMCDPFCAPSLEHVDFIGNEATGSGGGATCIFSDDAEFFEVTFTANTALAGGGGLSCSGSDLTLDEATFLGNSAREGGAISLYGCSPSISHATMADNESLNGGGVYCGNGSSPTIRTSIIALSLGGGSVYCGDGASQPDTRQSCLYGNSPSDAPCGISDDIIYDDPLFCDLAEGDVTLCANSPCLPSGNTWGLRIGDRGEGCSDCDSSLTDVPLTAASRTAANNDHAQ